jgi:hypothetical protein
MFLPARKRGEVAPSYGDGVMGHTDLWPMTPPPPAGTSP